MLRRMPRIFIDADACAVKDETYRVAKRHGLVTTVVANQWMNMPNDPAVRLEVVDDGFDAADDWIAERVGRGDIVVCEDIPLAARCVAKGAVVITGRGVVHDERSIGAAVAQRDLMQSLREAGVVKGGQQPMQDRDRAVFAQGLERLVQAAKLAQTRGP
jgi:uncharacterized protein YaiI (UPF0178 family)